MSDFLTGPSPTQPPSFNWGGSGPDFETVPPTASQPDSPLYEPTAPGPVKNSGHTRRVIGMLAGAGVLVLGTIVAAAAMGSGTNKVVVHGTMELTDVDGVGGNAANCWGDGGYDDLASGTQVTVKNGKGDLLATTVLGEGEGLTMRDFLAQNNASDPTMEYLGSSFMNTVVQCTWHYEVKVPDNEDFYSVVIGSDDHRGTITNSRDDMKENGWTFETTLGS